MLSTLIISAIMSTISGGTAWYVARRGIQGVKNDVANATSEVEKIKAHIFPAATPAPAPAPVVVQG